MKYVIAVINKGAIAIFELGYGAFDTHFDISQSGSSSPEFIHVELAKTRVKFR